MFTNYSPKVCCLRSFCAPRSPNLKTALWIVHGLRLGSIWNERCVEINWFRTLPSLTRLTGRCLRFCYKIIQVKKYVCQFLVTSIYLILRYEVNPWGFKTEVYSDKILLGVNIIVLFWLTNLYREFGAKYGCNQSTITILLLKGRECIYVQQYNVVITWFGNQDGR